MGRARDGKREQFHNYGEQPYARRRPQLHYWSR